MIDGFPIAQIPIGPALLDSGQGVAPTGSAAGTSFEGLLGSILTNNGLGSSVSNLGNDAASNKLSSNLINALHASGPIPQEDFFPTDDNSRLSGISGLLGKILSLLNQISDRKFVPLEAVFDLEKMGLKGIGLPGALGQNILKGSAVILAQESALQALQEASAGKSAEISIPVLVLFKDGENGADQFSLMAATLTLGQQETDSPPDPADSSVSNELQYFLTFMAPVEEPYGLDQNSRSDDPETPFKALAASISELLRFLEHFGIGDGSGSRLQELQGSIQSTPPVGKNSPVQTGPTGMDLLKTINTNQTGTLAENASAVLEAVEAFLDKLESNITARTGQVEIPAADMPDTLTEKKTLLVLVNILRHGLNQTVRNGDAEKLREIISMFDRLARLEKLSAAEQKATLDSLLKEIKSLVAQAGQQANATLETLKTGNGNSAETTILSRNGLEGDRSGVYNGQYLDKLFVLNSGETTLKDIFSKGGISPEIFSENENILLSSQFQSQGQRGSVLNIGNSEETLNPHLTNGDQAASGETGNTAKILAEAAGKISLFLSSMLGNSENSPAATGTGASRYPGGVIVPADSQISGAGENSAAGTQSNILSANAAKPGAVLPGEASHVQGGNSQIVNGSSPGMKFNIEEILQGSKAFAEKVDSASGTGSGSAPVNSKDAGGAINMAAGLDAAEKNSRVLCNITVPVKINGAKKDRASSNSGLRYNASVEYVKLSTSGAGSAAKGHLGFLAGLEEIKGEGGMGEMLETLLEENIDSDELLARLERGEVSDKVKTDQLFSSYRNELSSLRGSAQKADQALAQRPTWPVNQAEVFEKIINAARLTRLGATSEISMRLEPDHLGRMRVRLTLDENHALSARIQVETQEARSLIEGSLHRLRESLAEQGLKVEKFNVDVRQDANQEQSQTFTETRGEGGSGSRGGMRTEGEDLAFASTDKDFEQGAKDSKILVNKYSYSTLEWVA